MHLNLIRDDAKAYYTENNYFLKDDVSGLQLMTTLIFPRILENDVRPNINIYKTEIHG